MCARYAHMALLLSCTSGFG